MNTSCEAGGVSNGLEIWGESNLTFDVNIGRVSCNVEFSFIYVDFFLKRKHKFTKGQ